MILSDADRARHRQLYWNVQEISHLHDHFIIILPALLPPLFAWR